MTLAAKSIVGVFVLAGLVTPAGAQKLIPAPMAPQSGYYIEFSDETTLPAGGIPTAPTAPQSWPAVPAHLLSGTAESRLEGSMASCDSGEPLWSGTGDGALPCDAACNTACMNDCGVWAHGCSVYASAVYLRPRNADVAFAVPVDGPITAAPDNHPIQIGGVGVVDPDYDLGFQAGINLAITPMTSLYAQLLMLDSDTSNQVATAAPNVMRSLVSHPSSTSAATDFLSGSADLSLQLDTVDFGLRHLFVGGPVYAVNYVIGARYSRLEQTFGATFVDNGREHVASDIDFDGAGLSLGLEAERQSCTSRWRIYCAVLPVSWPGSFRVGISKGKVLTRRSWTLPGRQAGSCPCWTSSLELAGRAQGDACG